MVLIEVCVGSACHLKGSYDIIRIIQNLVDKNNISDQVEIKAAFCLGNCTKPVSVRINKDNVYSVTSNNAEQFFNENVLTRL